MWIRTSLFKKRIFYLISVFFHIALLSFPISYPVNLASHKDSDFIKVNLIEIGKSTKSKTIHQQVKVKGFRAKVSVRKKRIKLKGQGKRIVKTVVKKGKRQRGRESKIEFVKKSVSFITVVPPKAIFSVKPEYPYIARKRGYEGKVVVRLLIGKDGRVKRLFLVKSSGYKVLDRSALKALKNWKFSPARIAGAPVEYWVEVPVVFRLSGQS